MADTTLRGGPAVALQTDQTRREILAIITRLQAGGALEEGSLQERTIRELVALLYAAVDALNQLDAVARSSPRAAS